MPARGGVPGAGPALLAGNGCGPAAALKAWNFKMFSLPPICGPHERSILVVCQC